MSRWPATPARRVLAALLRIGWQIKRQSGSHRTMTRERVDTALRHDYFGGCIRHAPDRKHHIPNMTRKQGECAIDHTFGVLKPFGLPGEGSSGATND